MSPLIPENGSKKQIVKTNRLPTSLQTTTSKVPLVGDDVVKALIHWLKVSTKKP
jgi:hypothetical protein